MMKRIFSRSRLQRTHRELTENSQRTHRELTENSQRTHRELTENSQRTRQDNKISWDTY